MTEEERWLKVENIVRKVIREELATIGGKKVKLRFESGKWIGVTDEQIEVWRAAYPAVNIESELNRAAAWIVSNPGEAPRSNFSRFLNSWMEKNQNRAAIRSIPVDRKAWSADQEPPKCSYCEKQATGTVNGKKHCSAHMYDAMDGRAA